MHLLLTDLVCLATTVHDQNCWVNIWKNVWPLLMACFPALTVPEKWWEYYLLHSCVISSIAAVIDLRKQTSTFSMCIGMKRSVVYSLMWSPIRITLFHKHGTIHCRCIGINLSALHRHDTSLLVFFCQHIRTISRAFGLFFFAGIYFWKYSVLSTAVHLEITSFLSFFPVYHVCNTDIVGLLVCFSKFQK